MPKRIYARVEFTDKRTGASLAQQILNNTRSAKRVCALFYHAWVDAGSPEVSFESERTFNTGKLVKIGKRYWYRHTTNTINWK